MCLPSAARQFMEDVRLNLNHLLTTEAQVQFQASPRKNFMVDKVEIGTGFSRRTSIFSFSLPLHPRPTFIHSCHCNTKHLTLTQTCMAQPLHDRSTSWQVPKLQMQGKIGTPENFPFRFKPLNLRSVLVIYSASAAPFLVIQQSTIPPHHATPQVQTEYFHQVPVIFV
jgi:hypothetical protein